MNIVSKEEIHEIMNMDGKVRGVALYTDAEYVRRHEGEEALQRVEEETKEMGYPIDYNEIRAMDWYPLGVRAVSLLAIKKTMNWSDEQIKEMGRAAPKYSIITKLMLRYFINLETLVGKLETYWRKNYNQGSLTGIIGNKSLSLYLRDFEIPAFVYPYIDGYFSSVLSIVIGKREEIRVEEWKWLPEDEKCLKMTFMW